VRRWTRLLAAPTSDRAVLNPLGTEGDAFKFLLYVLGVFVVLVVVILAARAIF
jgi:hypothetical protein